MNVSEKDNRFIEFVYDEYKGKPAFQHYGIYGSVLVKRFTRTTGIRFGNAGAQLEAISRLLNRGWIEIEPVIKNTSVQLADKVRRITPLGIEYVENLRQPWIKRHWKEIYTSTIEAITRAFKPH